MSHPGFKSTLNNKKHKSLKKENKRPVRWICEYSLVGCCNSDICNRKYNDRINISPREPFNKIDDLQYIYDNMPDSDNPKLDLRVEVDNKVVIEDDKYEELMKKSEGKLWCSKCVIDGNCPYVSKNIHEYIETGTVPKFVHIINGPYYKLNKKDIGTMISVAKQRNKDLLEEKSNKVELNSALLSKELKPIMSEIIKETVKQMLEKTSSNISNANHQKLISDMDSWRISDTSSSSSIK